MEIHVDVVERGEATAQERKKLVAEKLIALITEDLRREVADEAEKTAARKGEGARQEP